MDYDRLFHQQTTIDPTLAWNMIHPGLQATTILSQRQTGTGNFCTLCQECDHIASHLRIESTAAIHNPGESSWGHNSQGSPSKEFAPH